MPSIEEVLGQLRSQPVSDVSAVSIANLKKQITTVWKAHEAAIVAATALETARGAEPHHDLPFQKPCPGLHTAGPPSLDCALVQVDRMKTGDPEATAGELADSRRQASAFLAVGFLLLYRTTDDASLRQGLLPVIDMVYDYGLLVKGRPGRDGTFAQIRQNLDQNIEALLTWVQ